MLAELRQARTDQDAEAFRRAAHSIKSNASSFGATALAELARSMELGDLAEDAAKGGSPLAALAALDAEYARTSAALKGVLNE